ncbi:MAG TPA: hypothetical protein VNU72_11820 [Puia sp.]|nr:hypothetical protein [Puia sp.]
MKITTFFLTAGMAFTGVAAAEAQSVVMPNPSVNQYFNQKLVAGRPWQPLFPPTPGNSAAGNPPPGTAITLQPTAPRARTLRPDNMTCVVPDMAKVERMPVNRRWNADPINRKLPAIH